MICHVQQVEGSIIGLNFMEELEEKVWMALSGDETAVHIPVFCGEFNDDGQGNKIPENPLTIYICYGLSKDGEDYPAVKFTLNNLVEHELSCVVDGVGKMSPECAKHIRSFTVALRALADKVDNSIKIAV